ncbi:MAG: succinyldiaminopimelate transaminase [Burkholderiaceae bacterium]|nr:succinyldiaminopimelate transaminase [Burkholderiaceae bacterium]
MNPLLRRLQPFSFARLRTLLAGVAANPELGAINLSIGEPKHPTPAVVTDAIVGALGGLSVYPPPLGSERLRDAVSRWIANRYGLEGVDPATQILPVNGTKEALFSFAQVAIDPRADAVVVFPNPCYQVYEGAALLAGATPHYVEQSHDTGFRCDWSAVPRDVWSRTQLAFACSPGNPSGSVMDLDQWGELFALSDRYGFAIASDECYSEIYPDESTPPLGALQAARSLGRPDFPRLMMFSSLSKRSNAPGLRSGFVSGDASLIKPFLHYRTYHGCAMSETVQAASLAAWGDEAHVRENRARYRAKFDALEPMLGDVLGITRPQGGFYFWARVPGGDDEAFVKGLYAQYNVLVLPGSYLARDVGGRNPGRGYVRLALVDTETQCIEAARRIREYCQTTPRTQ